MCFKTPAALQPATIEEIIAKKSIGMTSVQKAEYWYELDQAIFALLGKVIDVELIEVSVSDWINTAKKQYPTLTDIKIADSSFRTIRLSSLHEILTQDWTNLVPYDSIVYNCDKYASELYNHLSRYYNVNAIIPVWGNTTAGYHGFNLAVVFDDVLEVLIARLVEPQSDVIFLDSGPFGKYMPEKTALELGVKKIE